MADEGFLPVGWEGGLAPEDEGCPNGWPATEAADVGVTLCLAPGWSVRDARDPSDRRLLVEVSDGAQALFLFPPGRNLADTKCTARAQYIETPWGQVKICRQADPFTSETACYDSLLYPSGHEARYSVDQQTSEEIRLVRRMLLTVRPAP